MTSGTARPRRLGSLGLVALLAGCATVVEVPVETPLQSKIDVSRFRRVLVAGFVSEIGETDMDIGSETTRLLQNQLRAGTRMQVLEPDHPPLNDAVEQVLETLGTGGKYNKQEKEQFKLETDRIMNDQEYWRKVGEEFQQPLIVAGKVGLEEQNRSGFQSEERVIRNPGRQPQMVRSNRYLERKGFSLALEIRFMDGRTGETLHREKFTEEVLYGEEQKSSPLSSYFELMDRLLPNFLGVISPQRIRGTRVLLK